MNGNFVNIDPTPEDNQKFLVCLRCYKVLHEDKRRPRWAFILERDTRFEQLNALEFRLIRPIIPIVSFFELPSGDQSACIGGSINYANNTEEVAERVPRLPEDSDCLFVKHKSTTAAQLTDIREIRPNMLRTIHEKVQHEYAWTNIVFDDGVYKIMEEHPDLADTIPIDHGVEDGVKDADTEDDHNNKSKKKKKKLRVLKPNANSTHIPSGL
jgi:hypothetical protein